MSFFGSHLTWELPFSAGSSGTRLLCRMVTCARAAASYHRQRTARAPSRLLPPNQRALDVLAVPGPQLDLEEVAPVGDQGAAGLLAEKVVHRSTQLAQPASRNGSLPGSKRNPRSRFQRISA